MKSLRQVLGLLLAAILLFFLIKPFLQTHAQLRAALLQIRWGWLLCSFAGILFYWSAYLYPFAKLLGSLAQRPVSFRTTFTLFHLANITRYLCCIEFKKTEVFVRDRLNILRHPSKKYVSAIPACEEVFESVSLN